MEERKRREEDERMKGCGSRETKILPMRHFNLDWTRITCENMNMHRIYMEHVSENSKKRVDILFRA